MGEWVVAIAQGLLLALCIVGVVLVFTFVLFALLV